MDDCCFGLLLVLTLVVIALGVYLYRQRAHKSEHCCGDAAAREAMTACPTCA